VCPIFYYRIFLPCYDCYDFEATIAHEVGHVLGFHHPDAEFEINLQATQGQRMGNATCWRALDHVELAPDKDLGDSIMYSMTTSRDRTCLTSDDLEGLNYLYPTCDGTLHPREDTGEPLCIKGKRMGGWVRLAYVVFGPWIIICLIFLLLQCIVRHHQKHNNGKSMKQLRGHFADKRKGLIKKVRQEGPKEFAKKLRSAPTQRNLIQKTRNDLSSSAELDLPPGWVTDIDKASGMTYYFNERTGDSQWEPPERATAKQDPMKDESPVSGVKDQVIQVSKVKVVQA